MLEKSSIEQALKKAKALVKKREFLKAQAIYSEILKIFPNNKKAQQGLMLIKKTVPGNSIQSPPQAALNELAALFSKGELSLVVQKSQDLVQHYPRNFVLWSFLGVANLGIGHATKAVQAFIKVTQLNPNYPEGYNNLGSALQQLGKYNESIKYFENAVLLKPDFSDAYYNNGISHQELNKLDLATELYRKAIEITPNNWQAYANMGRAFKMLGELEKSLTAYNGAVAINSTDPELFSNIGNVFLDQDKLDEAIDAYKKAISLKPDYAEAYNNMGNALREQDKLDEAILCYQKSFTFKPNFSLAFNNMGTALKEQGKLEQAIELYKKALNLDPRNAEAYNNMGTILSEQEKSEDAIAAFKEALTLKPDYPEAYLNMGIAYAAQGKLEQAFKAYKKSLTLQPDFAEVYNNMGILLNDQGQLDEAIEAYNKAIDLKPDYATAHLNLSFALLNADRLREGLSEYEWRWKTKKRSKMLRRFKQPIWDGRSSLDGKRVLVWCEQGVGDTINWVSCLPVIAAEAKHCILECQEKLVPLLKRSFSNIEVRGENRKLDAERQDFDIHLPMGSLYGHCITKTPLDTNGTLIPNPARVRFWKKRLQLLGNGPYIGISWKSGNLSQDRLQNYAPLSAWEPVLKLPGVTFINLQYTNFIDDLIEIKNNYGVTVHNFDDLDHYDDLDDVAALCASLDIVVSPKITVPFISSGVGTTTKLANWKQSSWNNVLLNPVGTSIDIFERDTWEPWDETFRLIADGIEDSGDHRI